jgi:hypothetical protein
VQKGWQILALSMQVNCRWVSSLCFKIIGMEDKIRLPKILAAAKKEVIFYKKSPNPGIEA